MIRPTFVATGAAVLAASLALLASPAAANDALRKSLQSRFPDLGIEQVNKSPIPGLWEVYADGQIFYADDKGDHVLLNGMLVDTRTRTNLTDERLSKLRTIDFASLPLDIAIKEVKGNGKRKLVVFSDADCPFCKRLEKSLLEVTDVTVYTFLYPIDKLHPQANERSRRVWCSADRLRAWKDWMLEGRNPTAAADCDNPVAKVAALGEKYRVNGTPTLVFSNGRTVPGALGAKDIERYLNDAGK
ncbi:MAG: DsbC family protein [Rhodocyclaceae bacterium]|nr:DsbC family protein [Rhodocyclaceae bacterium]